MRLADACPDGLPLWRPGAHVCQGFWVAAMYFQVQPGDRYAYFLCDDAGPDSEAPYTDVSVCQAIADDWKPHPTCPMRGRVSRPEWWSGGEWVGDNTEAQRGLDPRFVSPGERTCLDTIRAPRRAAPDESARPKFLVGAGVIDIAGRVGVVEGYAYRVRYLERGDGAMTLYDRDLQAFHDHEG